MHRNCRIPEQYHKRPFREHVILIFEKLGVLMEAMDIVACHRLGETGRVIAKLLNRKDAQNVLEEKHKLRSINLYDGGNTDTKNKRKIFINQSLCRSSRPEVFCKEVFLEISQNSQENTSARDSFLIKLHASGGCFCLCSYYRKLYGMMKDLNNEGLIDSFWIANGTIKIRESSQSKPISITHESDLQF